VLLLARHGGGDDFDRLGLMRRGRGGGAGGRGFPHCESGADREDDGDENC